MSGFKSLLPANSTLLERRLEETNGRFNPPDVIRNLWNARTCPVGLLPYLAWAMSVDEWDPQWPEERKRTAIEEADFIHRHKGTPGAIKRALAVLGHPDAIVIERADYVRRDGSRRRNGWNRRVGEEGWATYRVVLQRPVTIDQAQRIYSVLDTVKRNCIHLVALDFTQASLRRNGFATRNGAYTRGVIS